MANQKMTPELRAKILDHNSTLSGTSISRCLKLKAKFGFCNETLANIIRQPSKAKVRNVSPISAKEKQKILSLYKKYSKVNEQYKIGLIADELNRNRADVRAIIKSNIIDKSIKMFNYKHPFHCFI